MRIFPFYHQMDQMDCGPTCLRMISKYYGRSYSAETIRANTQTGKQGVSLLGIADAAEEIGFKTLGVKIPTERLLQEAAFPCILHWDQKHFVVLYEAKVPSYSNFKGLLFNVFKRRRLGDEDNYNRQDSTVSKDYDRVNSKRTSKTGLHKRFDYRTVFYIADPARGLLRLNLEEFENKWISKGPTAIGEGLALILEPSTGFYNLEGENSSNITIGKLLRYLVGYKRLILQLFLGMLISSGLSLILPFLTQAVVDFGIGGENLSFINLILISQMAVMCGSAAVDFIRSWILLHISTRLNLTILSEFLAKLMKLPISFFEAKRLGDVIQRIGDHKRIETFLTGQALSVLFSCVNLLIFGFVLAYYHSSIFTVALSSSLIYTFWIVIFLGKRRHLDFGRFDISSRSQSLMVELIQGIRDIKLAGAETSKRWEWERVQIKSFKWSVKSLSISQWQQAGTIIINQSKNIFITFLAARAVINGDLSIGGLVSVQYIIGQFNAPIEQFLGFIQSWQDAKISVERLNEVHQQNDEEIDKNLRQTWDSSKSIIIQDLSYAYPGAGNELVLEQINCVIPAGKTTAIVGMSGSGKSTLLKILLRFYEPQSGNIFLEEGHITLEGAKPLPGLNVKNISHKAWRSGIGAVMQDGYLFSDTIAKNIAINESHIDIDRLDLAAKTANIYDFIEGLPLGYSTLIGAEGNGLSQGQKQRILIARSVYKNPKVLLFDEATNALDSKNELIIMNNLRAFFENRTVIVVAHRLSTVKNADQIIVLEKGKLVESGTHWDLIRLEGRYHELVSNQLNLSEG